jgi:Tfp pilus assembly protein PilO
MSATESGDRRSTLKMNLLERLHEPVQLRIFLVTAVVLVGYFAVYSQFQGHIEQKTKMLERERKLLDLAVRFEQLEEQYHRFQARVPQQADSKEWLQYLLEGTRALPVRLLKLDCREPLAIGPYKAIVFQAELEGTFFDLDKFLRWIESNPRLLRVDEVMISAAKDTDKTMSMRLTILGLTG